MLAVLDVEDVWQPDRKAEAQSVFGTTSAAHPGADYAINKSNPCGMWAAKLKEFRNLRTTISARYD